MKGRAVLRLNSDPSQTWLRYVPKVEPEFEERGWYLGTLLIKIFSACAVQRKLHFGASLGAYFENRASSRARTGRSTLR